MEGDAHARDRLSGMAIGNGAEVNARRACDLGLTIGFPGDAMRDVSAGAHGHSVARVFPGIGETGATGDIIALLQRGA